MPEDLVLEEDLLGDLLRAADEVRAAQIAAGLELLAGHRRPAALAADAVHHRLQAREGDVGGGLRGVGDEAVRVDAQRQAVVPGLGGGLAVQLGERREALGLPADDRQRQRQAEHAGAHDRPRRAADGDPDGQRVLHRPRVDAEAVERGAVAARPRDVLARAQREQQLELLGEQLVVVVEVVAEEREGLDERAAPGHDLRAPAGEQVDRREVLEDADGVVRAEHRDRARQADALRARGRGAEHDGRRRHGEVGAVVLADAEDVEADLVGELDLLHQVAQALLRADRPPVAGSGVRSAKV